MRPLAAVTLIATAAGSIMAAGCGLSAAAVANTDSFFSSLVEWQPGHSGVVPERTNASNSLPQPGQTYS